MEKVYKDFRDGKKVTVKGSDLKYYAVNIGGGFYTVYGEDKDGYRPIVGHYVSEKKLNRTLDYMVKIGPRYMDFYEN